MFSENPEVRLQEIRAYAFTEARKIVETSYSGGNDFADNKLQRIIRLANDIENRILNDR